MVQKAHLRANASEATRATAKELERQAILAAFNDAEPGEKETIAAMVAVGLEVGYDHAQAAFKKQPVGDNWRNLENAMWAWQYWRNQVGVDRLLTAFALRDVGVGFWVETLAKLHRGESKHA